MRTFIAVKIPFHPNIPEVYTNVRNELKNEKISWVNPDNFHLTLKFIGEIQEDFKSQIIEVLRTIPNLFKTFNFTVKGLGVFPNPHKASVIWMGIEKHGPLIKLNEYIEQNLANRGLPKSDKKFSAHLTMARIKQPVRNSDIKSLIKRFEHKHMLDVYVDKVIFYQSILSAKGPKYHEIFSVFLGKA